MSATYTLHVLFGQRKCSYDGQYAPEALAVADQFTMDENPDYMETQIREARSSGDFSSLRVLAIQVPRRAVEDALQETVQVKGEVKP